MALLDALDDRLCVSARILDVGCGAGVPVARRLIELGHRVIGVDLSGTQLELAKRRVDDLIEVQADMAWLPLGSHEVDAIVCYYALIHVPREDHAGVIREFQRVLRPGGWALLCIGTDDNPEDLDTESWLGAPMYWSHYDAATTMQLIAEAGFSAAEAWDVPDPMAHGSHRFVLAENPVRV